MHTRVLSFALFALALIPSLAHAQELTTDNWRITVSEQQIMRLNFAIEYIGTDLTPGQNTVVASSSVDVPAAPATAIVSTPSVPTTEYVAPIATPQATLGQVILNEFVSDPIAGEAEWIELYNTTNATLDISGWYVLEGSGKKTEVFGTIEPYGYRLLSPISGSLNNAGDLVQLFSAKDVLADEVVYGIWNDGSVENNAPVADDPQSTGRTSNGWATMSATPGTQNAPAFDVATSTGTTGTPDGATNTSIATNSTTNNTQTNSNTYDLAASSDTSVSNTTATSATSSPEDPAGTAEVVPFVELTDIRSIAIGTEIVTEGTVAVEPGTLGKQYFYLAGSGVQVYLYSADFPSLLRGMRVRVQGVTSQVAGETRIKIRTAEDVNIIGMVDAPSPHDLAIGSIGESTEGWLVRVTGTLVGKENGNSVLSDNTGDIRVVVQPGTGIAMPGQIGDTLTVTGLVSETTSGYRLLPRDQADVLLRQPVDATTTEEMSVPPLGGVIREHDDTSSGMAGWVLSIATVLALAGSATWYYTRRRVLINPNT